MAAQWLLALMPLFALCANVFSQVISVRFIAVVRLSIIIGLIAGIVVVLLMQVYLVYAGLPFSVLNLCVCLATYLALSFCYFAFLNLNMTSLRIRVIRELLNEKNGLSGEALMRRYSPQELITRRIIRLQETGQIIKIDGKWFLQSRNLLVFVIVSSALRKLIIPNYSSGNENNA